MQPLAWEAYERIERSVETMIGDSEEVRDYPQEKEGSNNGWDMSQAELEEKLKKKPANVEFFEYRSVKQLKKMGLLHQPSVIAQKAASVGTETRERVNDWLDEMKPSEPRTLVDILVETRRKVQIRMDGQQYEVEVNMTKASMAIRELEAFALKYQLSQPDLNRLLDAVLMVK
jgi:hypothetical protein